jgi:hypothetical protein
MFQVLRLGFKGFWFEVEGVTVLGFRFQVLILGF